MITPHSMANGNISASDNDNNEHTRQCYRTNENVHPSPPIALYSCSLSRRLCFLSVVGSRECEQRILLLDALFCTTEMHGEWKNVVCGSGEVRTGEQTRARAVQYHHPHRYTESYAPAVRYPHCRWTPFSDGEHFMNVCVRHRGTQIRVHSCCFSSSSSCLYAVGVAVAPLDAPTTATSTTANNTAHTHTCDHVGWTRFGGCWFVDGAVCCAYVVVLLVYYLMSLSKWR